MYKLIRNIHLLLGASAALFILVYAVSAVQMAHQYAIRPQISDEDVALAPSLEARPLAQALMDQHGYRGDLNNVKTENGRLKLTISRPGTNYVINYDPASGRIDNYSLLLVHIVRSYHHYSPRPHVRVIARIVDGGWGMLFYSRQWTPH